MDGKIPDWSVQPKDVVALVKFEDNRGKILYEARYTNCHDHKKHAEDFFKDDINSEDLASKVRDNNDGGKITLYLTLQPCNESTKSKNTRPDQSCCETLADIYRKTLQGKKISLCVKVTHTCNLILKPKKDDHEHLIRHAVAGITALMLVGVEVESMAKNDWEYLFGMTDVGVPQRLDQRRIELDETVEDTLTEIEEFTNSLNLRLSQPWSVLLTMIIDKLEEQQQG